MTVTENGQFEKPEVNRSAPGAGCIALPGA